MKLTDLLGALRRRWILTFVCLALTAGLGVGAAQLVGQRYTVTAHVLFLPPTATVATAANPYMQLGGLYQAVELVGVALSDQETTAEIKAMSSEAVVSVVQDPQSSAPLLLITVVDTDRARTLQILDVMLAKVPARLDELQAAIDIRQANRVTSMVLTKDDLAEPTGLDQLRAIILAVAAGLLLTTLLVALLDGVWLRRQAVRGVRGASDDAAPGMSPAPGFIASPPTEDENDAAMLVGARDAPTPAPTTGGGRRSRAVRSSRLR